MAGIVLAQVSMARLAGEIRERTGLPVLESLTTSLAGVRGARLQGERAEHDPRLVDSAG